MSKLQAEVAGGRIASQSPRPGLRVGVVANCQVDPLRHALMLASPEIQFVSYNVNLLRSESDQVAAVARLAKCDIVMSQPLTHGFGPIQPAELRSAGMQVIEFPNLYYSGFHPDISYVGGFGDRILSPAGSYHSVAVIYGFLSGWAVSQTVSAYQEVIAAVIDPRRVEQISRTALFERSAAIGFPAEHLFEELSGRVFMYTVNHPMATPVVFIARWLLNQIGLGQDAPWEWVEAVLDNPLSRSVAWPVWNPSARWRPVFRGPRGEVLTLNSFVEKSYELYEGATEDHLIPRRPDLASWPWERSS